MSEISEFLKYTPEENDQVITHNGVEFIIREEADGDCIGFYNNRFVVAHTSSERCVAWMQKWIDEHPVFAHTQYRKKAFARRVATKSLTKTEQKVFDYFSSNLDRPINAIMVSEDLKIHIATVKHVITGFKALGLVRKSTIPTCYIFVRPE